MAKLSPMRSAVLPVALAILTPYAARLPGMATSGPDWFWSYLPSLWAVLFFALFAAIPGATLAALARRWPGNRAGRWIGSGLMVAALFAMHATLDLAADAQAAVALVIFPFIACVPAAAGFALGALIRSK